MGKLKLIINDKIDTIPDIIEEICLNANNCADCYNDAYGQIICTPKCRLSDAVHVRIEIEIDSEKALVDYEYLLAIADRNGYKLKMED